VLKLVEAAELCQLLYGDVGEGVGPRTLEWQLLKSNATRKPEWAVYWKNSVRVLVLRGTDVGKDFSTGATDVINDLAIAAGFKPSRVDPSYTVAAAEQQTALASKERFYIIGHSLGGALAQIVGYYLGANFIAFNPPPVRGSVSGWVSMKPSACQNDTFTVSSEDFDKGCIIRASEDDVSWLSGQFIGRAYRVKVLEKGLVAGHLLPTLIDAIESNPQFKEIEVDKLFGANLGEDTVELAQFMARRR
jgi:hypothetical protein